MTSENFRTNLMFLRNQFKGDGVFEIPKIEKEEINLENIELIGYDRLNENETEKIVHFFLDDYKFEVMWKDPEPRIEKLKKYKAVLAPNFSIYTEMPLSLKLYNTFRSRWCGAYLQAKGIKVIPTIVWGEPDTFWFCFNGVAQGSVVAVSTVGVRKEKSLFMQEYTELMRKVKPKAVICYGEPFEEMQGRIITVDYATTNNLSSKNVNSKIYIKKVSQSIIIPGVNGINLKSNQLEQKVDFYNPDKNNCYFRITLYLSDDTLIWQSNLIEPSKHITEIKLNQALQRGLYRNCRLVYDCYTLDEKSPLNGGQVKLEINSY